MAVEWVRTTLGELAELRSGGTPSKSRPDYWTGSIPWLSAKDMKRFRIDDTEDHVTEEAAKSGSRLVPAGSVFMLTRGMTLLKDVPICVAERPMAFNQDVKALLPRRKVLPKYLPYLVLGNKQRLHELVDLAGHGTGRLNTDEVKALDVVLPPPEEQRAISTILGALDDKIELNRRMSETLEEMARALFDQTFVAAWSENPDDGSSMKAVPVSSLVEILSGGTPKTSEPSFWGGAIPWFSVADTPPGSDTFVIDTAKKITALGVESSAAQVVPEWTTILTARGTVGKIAMAGVPLAFNQSCFGLRPRSGAGPSFVFLLANHIVGRLRALAHGSVFSTITRSTFESVYFPRPTKSMLDAFETTAQPLFSRILIAVRETQTLAQLRDALLPKLISGELRVPDAERLVSEVV